MTLADRSQPHSGLSETGPEGESLSADERLAERIRGLRTDQDWEGWLRLAAKSPGHSAAKILLATGQTDEAAPARQRPAPSAVWEALSWLARRHGFTVEREPVRSASLTIWAARQVVIDPEAEAAEANQLLLHELGHVFLHRPITAADADTAGCRGARRVEADSVAFVVAVWLGLDAERYSWPYVESWAGSDARAQPEAAVLTAATHITRAAATIVGHLDVTLFGRQPEHAEPTPTRSVGPSRPPRAERRNSARRGDQHPRAGTSNGPTASDIYPLLAQAEQFYLDRLDGSWAADYLAGRGLDSATIQRRRIGFAPPGWTPLTSRLRDLGYRDELIEAAGLARRSSRGTLFDHFRDRVMLAIRASDGQIAGFIGRANPEADPSVPKYLNSPETAAYVKGDLLFGLHETRRQINDGAVPVIAEGPFDAIAITTADPAQYAGLAPCGTALTTRQVAALGAVADLHDRLVLVALDGDRAGRVGAVRAHALLSPVMNKTAAVVLPAGQDPAAILQANGPAALAATLRRDVEPLARVVIDAHLDQRAAQLQHPEGRLTALRSAASLIASTLPAQTATAILATTGGRQLRTLDDTLHPVANRELIAIASILPSGPVSQVVRAAQRLDTECSDVIAAVANTLASTATVRARSPARQPAARADPPTPAPGLSGPSFPPSSRPQTTQTERAPPEPRRPAAAVSLAAGRRSAR
jgi:DNA primase